MAYSDKPIVQGLWAEAAHITIASLKDLMSFFHIRLFIISPLPPLLERRQGGDVFFFVYSDDRKIP